MSTIVVKDLQENVDLDRQAMLAIAGGSRFGGRPSFLGHATIRAARVVNLPPGFAVKGEGGTDKRQGPEAL